MSVYIVSHCPLKYGGKQEDYLRQTQVIIHQTAQGIGQAVYDKKNLTKLFHTILADLGKKRRAIAVEHGTKKSHSFGSRRDRRFYESAIDYTHLGKSYGKYGQKVLAVFQKHLPTGGKKSEIYEKGALYEFSSFPDSPEQFPSPITFENGRRIYGICSLTFPAKKRWVSDFVESDHHMNLLRTKSPHDYAEMQVNYNLIRMKVGFKSSVSQWNRFSAKQEITGQLRPLSECIACTLPGQAEPRVQIIHTNAHLIEPILEAVADLFKKAIEWNGENRDDLFGTMALMQYKLAHAMPFTRGSAAISEWIEMSIYRYHGYHLKYSKDQLVNLEALTSTFDEFAKNYPTMIELSRAPLISRLYNYFMGFI
jgi:hypothetical protein